ncbi:MAG: MotA/TolQ/ExbB proton channel family protein [Planctomycetaceae bacterium]|jgi:biopolymer transport protein ExbB|nr:MotA/TolQ/ExbB proton channel family protein [Planctomycetaceae bacterium]
MIEHVKKSNSSSILLSTLLLAMFVVLALYNATAIVRADDKLDLTDAEKIIGGEPDTTAAAAVPVQADGTTTQQRSANKGGITVFGLLRSSGTVGFFICLLSLAAAALIIEHLLTIRRSILIPTGLPDELLGLINTNKWVEAHQRAVASDSMLGNAVAAALTECELGWDSVEKGAEEAIAEQAAKLYRKVEYLNLIGSIAPMVGLLGTVVGMVVAFSELAETQGYARASDLAVGIYLALVTTVEGLVVAIPSLTIYSILTNKIASISADATFLTTQILLPVKKRLIMKR